MTISIGLLTENDVLAFLDHYSRHCAESGANGEEHYDVARILYESLGFEEVGLVEDRFRGSALTMINLERGVDIQPDTVVTCWQGERMDYSLAIDGLLGAR